MELPHKFYIAKSTILTPPIIGLLGSIIASITNAISMPTKILLAVLWGFWYGLVLTLFSYILIFLVIAPLLLKIRKLFGYLSLIHFITTSTLATALIVFASYFIALSNKQNIPNEVFVSLGLIVMMGMLIGAIMYVLSLPKEDKV